jgi:hypothetical protein
MTDIKNIYLLGAKGVTDVRIIDMLLQEVWDDYWYPENDPRGFPCL